jgi:magnesium-transporting ATPase (P-type)
MEALKDVILTKQGYFGRKNNSHSNRASSGDVVLLEAGNRIPLMFVLSKPIKKVDESTLTGESTIDKTSEKLPAGEYSLGDYSNLGFKGTLSQRTRKRLCHGNRYGNGTWSHCTDDSITRFINSITNTISCLR